MSSSAEFDEKREKDLAKPSPGERPLDPSLRGDLEGPLGDDLGRVRIHTDREAREQAEAEGSRAVARNEDVYFAGGEFRPGTRDGLRLLAHELAHSRQAANPQGVPAGRTELEGEADRVADAVLRGEPAPIALQAAPGQVLREEKGKTAAPVVAVHAHEVTPIPGQGTLTGAGITVGYRYGVGGPGSGATLTLDVPSGVALMIQSPTGEREGSDYRVENASGGQARSVKIAVAARSSSTTKLEATLSRGNATFRVVFQFPGVAPRKG